MAVSKRLRYEILRRDNFACRYCGAAAPDVKLNADHVIPQSLGGSDEPTNLVTSCTDCNSGKTSSMPNAMVVADVDQETFRRAAELKQAELTDHLWRGGYPPQWGPQEIERHAADAAWTYAWSIASRGGEPSHDQYTEFLVHSAALFENGRSVGEVVCAAVHAGTQLTPHLSWGLGVSDLQYVPISGEQFSRMAGVYDRWLAAWRERRATEPTGEQTDEFRGRLILAVRDGYSRDELMQGARSAAFAGNTDVDYFAYHVACEGADAKVGDN
ncbi:HNH endonuclease [Streptomyces sp. NPDC002758]